MKTVSIFFALIALIIQSCSNAERKTDPSEISYFEKNDTSVQTGGIKMIKIETPKGNFNVWTKRIGNNPTIKVLLLHGGPGGTHESFECFDSFFPEAGIEYYYYDQLGSYYSDQPEDTSLWKLDRFVEEVEQVRKALDLSNSNFYLYGLSWGGILAMEYALKYQNNLKALIISNMMASCPEYGKYAEEVLSKQMDADILLEIRDLEARKDFSNPRYNELLFDHYYTKHICRLDEWPEPVTRLFKHLNYDIYVQMQGPSEFGIAGSLAEWDRKSDLVSIKVPTLTIGAKYDTMDPEHMKWISSQVQLGKYLYCPNGSHLSMYDDQKIYFQGLIEFIKNVDQGTFKNDTP
ncbi:MAG: proline iminopeptidase-family hydrolase [Bacteroidales bacterium]